ncbi:MAG: hypothetical protein VKJ09_00280 [Leptolyngbya sp.]|nr:hypothetical protein [Leptolyngbya sp.]
MKLFQVFEDVVEYFSDAFARIFGPNDEPVPSIGVQPFEGDLPSESED